VWALLGVLLFQGASGVGGGLGLVLDPTGASLGIPAAWRDGSPFPDYRTPGLVLLVPLGIGPLAVAWSVLRRRVWAWSASLLVGAALLVWLGVEVAVVGYEAEPPLQAVYGAVAGALLGLARSRPARRHLGRGRRERR
jgi:peptidoglycan/LPS O-acetylase OafA/YrhL